MQTPYTTKEKVTAAYTSTATDEQKDAAIALASTHIDGYVGYRLASESSESNENILVDGSGTEYIVFPQSMQDFSAANVKRVANDGVTLTDVTGVVGYPLNRPFTSYIALRSGVFTSGIANYEVQGVRYGRYTVAWSALVDHTLPEDVTSVCTALAIEILKAGGIVATTEKAGQVASETMGSYSVTYKQGATDSEAISSVPSAQDILSKYRTTNIV
jgi:hypothetical protein